VFTLLSVLNIVISAYGTRYTAFGDTICLTRYAYGTICRLPSASRNSVSAAKHRRFLAENRQSRTRKAERYSIGKFPHGGNSPIQFTFAKRTYLIEDISYSYIAFAKRIYRVYLIKVVLSPQSVTLFFNRLQCSLTDVLAAVGVIKMDLR